MKQMATRLLDHDTVTVPLEEVVSARPMAAAPAKKSRSITAALAFLIGCVTLMMTGFAVIIPVFPQRLQALGLGPETLALMEGAFGLGMFLFSTPMGTWSGRIGRKPILFISLAGFIVTNLLLAFFMVPETLPEHVRVEARPQQANRGAKAQKPKEWRMAHLIWLVAPFLIIDFGMIFTFPFVFPQLPFFFEKVLHYSPAQYGMLFSVYGMALAIFPLVLGRLSEILPKKPLIVIGSLLFSALFVFLLAAPLYPLLIAGAALAGLGSAFVEPAMGSIYLGATTDENRGQIMGMRGSAISLAVMLGPLAQALVGLWITPQITFAIGVALSF